ncbi:hypothetical protein [Acinetobacter terrae]|uniref:Uncharacterized protein n=1 Tax=Acinetobacter terrae TaxID=2731247 RepID=A0A4R0ERA5_9GAMM|nr:hypothetical protein [Acinetobacter terrae]TCB62238.1 hypothetical protein E0H85_01575 [Acinetobacter terrae]
MTNEQMVELARDLTEALAPYVISGDSARMELDSESISVIYHSLVGFTSRNEQPNVDMKLPFTVIQSLREVS